MEPNTQYAQSRRRRYAKAALLVVIIAALLAGAYYWQKHRDETAGPNDDGNEPSTKIKAPNLMTATELQQSLGTLPTDVLNALKAGNYAALAGYVHPDKGLLLSPYSYPQVSENIVLTREQVAALAQDKTVHTWGSYDGSGDPIKLTSTDYFKKFVYSSDFLKAPQVGYNTRIGQGNSLNSIPQTFPNAGFVEYHFPGFDPQYEGMDWQSLRLVFEHYQEKWQLVGIVHDQWTI